MEEKEEWLKVEDAAAQLKVSKQTILKLIRSGELQASKVGWQWRIKRSDLERYLAGGKS